MRVIVLISTVMYMIAALSLFFLSFFIMIWSVYESVVALQAFSISISKLLESVGAIIISIAVLDVAKYLVEEEVFRRKELRLPSEARQTITKIFVIISIAAGMEGLVYIFKSGNLDLALLIYPSILIFLSSLSIVCLGIYQKLSITVEKATQAKQPVSGASSTQEQE